MGDRADRVPNGVPSSATIRVTSLVPAATETCWPSTARTASSQPSGWPGTRRPGAALTSVPDDRIGAQVRGDRRRVALEVQQIAAPGRGRLQVAPVIEDERRLHVVGAGDQIDDTGAVRQRQVRRIAAGMISSMPGTTRAPRKASDPSPSNGARAARRIDRRIIALNAGTPRGVRPAPQSPSPRSARPRHQDQRRDQTGVEQDVGGNATLAIPQSPGLIVSRVIAPPATPDRKATACSVWG